MTVISGLVCFISMFLSGGFSWLFAKNEAVVEEKVNNHNDGRSKDESAGGEDEFIVKGEVKGACNIESEFVKWSEETKELSESRGDGDGEDGIPDEEFVDGGFSDFTLLPGDFRVGEVGDDGGDGGGDKI